MCIFDMGSKFSDEYKLTIAALCKELEKEDEKRQGNDITGKVLSEEDYRKKLKNPQKSGIVDKLLSHIDFDIEAIAEKSPQEKFAELRVLKLLYRVEKDSSSNIRFTDILQKPRLDNIPTEFSNKSKYGAVFSEIMSKVENEVPDAQERATKIGKINAYWEFLTDRIMEYVMSDKALSHPKEAMNELERIEKVLNEKVLARIRNAHLKVTSYNDGVMETFYNILYCHRELCNEIDRININYKVVFEEAPSKEYCDKFVKNEELVLTNEAVPEIKAVLEGENDGDAGIQLIIYLISYGKGIEDYKKDYKFALKYYGVVVDWMEKNTAVDNSHGIFLTEFVSIIQEIVAVKRNDERFSNDYYGNKYTAKPLLSAIKKPVEADAVAVQAWIKKIQNRMAINFGVCELIKKKRSIENIIYQIKSEIFRYQNIDDLDFVNAEIVHFAALPIISREYAINVSNEFAQMVARDFFNEVHLSIIMPSDGINILNMFREFTMDRTNTMPLVAKDVAKQLKEFYQEDSGVYMRGMRCDFKVSTVPNKFHDYVFTFMVLRDINNKNVVMEYKNFAGVVSDEHADRMCALGLKQFVRDNPKMF